jgi:hypothetical protein
MVGSDSQDGFRAFTAEALYVVLFPKFREKFKKIIKSGSQ